MSIALVYSICEKSHQKIPEVFIGDLPSFIKSTDSVFTSLAKDFSSAGILGGTQQSLGIMARACGFPNLQAWRERMSWFLPTYEKIKSGTVGQIIANDFINEMLKADMAMLKVLGHQNFSTISPEMFGTLERFTDNVCALSGLELGIVRETTSKSLFGLPWDTCKDISRKTSALTGSIATSGLVQIDEQAIQAGIFSTTSPWQQLADAAKHSQKEIDFIYWRIFLSDEAFKFPECPLRKEASKHIGAFEFEGVN